MTELETKLLAALKVADGHLTTEFYGLCYEPSPSDPLGVIRAAIAEAEVAQQQAPQPSGDGWIPWAGGECPLKRGAIHQVRFRDGFESDPDGCPEGWHWRHDGNATDIVAYRVVKEPQQ